MNYRKSLLITIIFFIGCCFHHSLFGQEKNKEHEKTVRAISKARADAFNEMDAGEIATYFSEDAVLMAPGKPAAFGREAVRKYYQRIFDAYKVTLESHYEEVEIEGNMAYGRGEATVKLIPVDGGNPSVSKSKYLNILQRQTDGSWKTTHDIWNSNE